MQTILLVSLMFLAAFLSGCGPLFGVDCDDTKCNGQTDPECRADLVGALCEEGGESHCASDSTCSCSGKSKDACVADSTCCYWLVAGGCQCQ